MKEITDDGFKTEKCSVEIVLPVYNEEAILESSVTALVSHLELTATFGWYITIADNASTDSTQARAQHLEQRFRGSVFATHLPRKGRGFALKEVWRRSSADVVAYMDIDLSTNLTHIDSLVGPLLRREFHVATGSRLMAGARTTRSLKREIISRTYNLLVWSFFPKRQFLDAQCGFKALTREAADTLLPIVVDTSWFFDTELLLRAEQMGYKVLETPVEWIEDLDSRVHIFGTAIEDVRGLIRVRRESLKTALRRTRILE